MQLRIIGKYILFFMLIAYMGISFGSIQLFITKAGGVSCTRMKVGSLCTVKIVCQGQGPISFPTVAGLNAFRVEGRSKTMSTINGVTTTTYMYQVRALHEGAYTIGPTYATVNGKTETSNTVTVHITNDQEHDQEQESSTETSLFLVRLHADTTSVVLGQAVHGTLSLYYRTDAPVGQAILDHLETPQWPELGIQVEQAPVQGKEKVDGIEYAYYRWHWKVVPKRSGTLIIPACTASCRVPSPVHDDDIFGGLGSFFGKFKQQHTASNSLRIMVHELPTSAKKHDAIGTFNGMNASVSDSTIKRQDATTLCITITGDESVETCTLRDMPDAVRWYDAKKTVHYDEHTKTTHTLFEFVIQGLREGTWTIPPQSLYYFDPRDHMYKTLTTRPLSITVAPNTMLAQPKQDTDHTCAETQLSLQAEQMHLWETEWNSIEQSTALPGPFFLLCLVASLCVYILSWYRERLSHVGHSTIHKRRAIQQAKKELRNARATGNASAVYAIFVQLWAHRLNIPVVQIDYECLIDTIQSTAMPCEKQEAWKNFVTYMMSMAYADCTVYDEQFFKEACAWIDCITPYL